MGTGLVVRFDYLGVVGSIVSGFIFRSGVSTLSRFFDVRFRMLLSMWEDGGVDRL